MEFKITVVFLNQYILEEYLFLECQQDSLRGIKMIKNIVFLIIIFMSQLTYAKIIELDNKNIAHCQEQLKNDFWDRNVVMLYVKDSPGTNKFRAIYEQVSTEYPERHLFALNVFDPKANAKENQLIWKTVKSCLTDMMYGSEKGMGDINAKTAALLLYDYKFARVGLGSGGHWLSTKDGLLEFMQEKTSDK